MSFKTLLATIYFQDLRSTLRQSRIIETIVLHCFTGRFSGSIYRRDNNGEVFIVGENPTIFNQSSNCFGENYVELLMK